MTNIETMNLALDALEVVYMQADFSNGVADPTGTLDEGEVVIGGMVSEAIAALRQAIGEAEQNIPECVDVDDYEAEQEPVQVYAYEVLCSEEEYQLVYPAAVHRYKLFDESQIHRELYTAPPQREWVSLTDDELDEIDGHIWNDLASCFLFDRLAYAHSVVSLCKEKNT